MTASFLAKHCLLVSALALAASSVQAADEASPSLTLSFTRTGTDVASVTVHTAGIEGVTATLLNASPTPFKSACNEVALCPDVNANTDPTIVFEFSITGLPAGFTFDQIGLKTHAYNANAGNQAANDGKNRFYNINIDMNDEEIAYKNNQDIAADNDQGHVFWDIDANSTISATSPMTLKLTVTKGDENVGCFFGLEEVTLKTDPAEPEPVVPAPVDPTGSKIYTIHWKNNSGIYINQTSGNTMQASQPNNQNMMFWEFIPTDKENCYYIRNTASGLYIGSCNMTPSSASRVSLSSTPVEYYVGHSASTNNENKGCVWLSSTDCANYDKESSGARCLNKDGASTFVITWTSGVNNTGSYWKLIESEDLYEAQPFIPSDEIGKPLALYHIIDSEGRSLTSEQTWDAVAEVPAQRWYFVGSSNTNGGYQIVSGQNDEAINSGTKYTVHAAEGGTSYEFHNGEETLSIAGVDNFRIVAARSEFAMKNQIYNMPCGTMGDLFITKVSIGDEFNYPMATVTNSKVTYPAALKPANKYVILSRDAAMVNIGQENPMEISLNKAPGNDYTLTLFIDWNKDGVFEHSQVLTPGTSVSTVIDVPEGTEPGITRARLRLTNNGMEGPEDEVYGEVLDLRLQIVDPENLIEPTVSVNAENRGTANYSDGVAYAEPKGNALFLYWQDNKRVASTDASFSVAPAPKARNLVAMFSPNTQIDDNEVALANISLKSGSILVNGSTLTVASDFEVKRILVFGLNGNLVASAAGTSELSLNLPAGVYIAKAITAGGTITAKIQL
ncbi:MAG: T9SS type A sorting domain-containing protein [Muribaculaceae bacterium]|nr:T9SS type A sorting domain-containing protein [Muribaculaceae bacterium]